MVIHLHMLILSGDMIHFFDMVRSRHLIHFSCLVLLHGMINSGEMVLSTFVIHSYTLDTVTLWMHSYVWVHFDLRRKPSDTRDNAVESRQDGQCPGNKATVVLETPYWGKMVHSLSWILFLRS